MLVTVKNTVKSTKLKHQNVASKKKQSYLASQQRQSKTKAKASLMTTLKKLGQLDTTMKQSLSVSA